jgi:uncharacterized protein with von Willebrand factor type A (vWA) domain
VTAPGSQFVSNVLVFGRVLRAAGFDVPIGGMLDLVDALTHVDAGSRDEVFHTSRALLVRRHEQLSRFRQIFDVFWSDLLNPFANRDEANPRDSDTTRALASAIAGIAGADTQDDAAGDGSAAARTWSDTRTLMHKDFAEFTGDELATAQSALDRLAWLPGERCTRRWVPGRGPRVDIRRAMRRSLRTFGDPIVLPTKRRRVHPRRLVLLCDVSGSMERYSRILLHFAHGVGQRDRRLEVFLFSTGLTRVTREIRTRRIDDALAAVTGAVSDWSGGTRIGHALQQFHQRWARRVMREGPVVLLISDGWDRGDPAVMRAQVARLQRSCHRLIWLNPLLGTAGYEPLTRGLQAALPFVDDFLAVRTLGDLGDLAAHLETVRGRSQRR